MSGFVFFSENSSYFWVISFMWVLLYDFRKSQPSPIVLKNTILLVNPHYPIKFKELNFTYTRAKLIQEPRLIWGNLQIFNQLNFRGLIKGHILRSWSNSSRSISVGSSNQRNITVVSLVLLNFDGLMVFQTLLKVISGRGSESVTYWDASYGNEVYHNEGDTVRLGCKTGFSNSIGKAFIGATCTCSGGYCGFVRARADFACIAPDVAPMPVWQGGVFNYITEVKDSYIVIKARAVNYIGNL